MDAACDVASPQHGVILTPTASVVMAFYYYKICTQLAMAFPEPIACWRGQARIQSNYG